MTIAVGAHAIMGFPKTAPATMAVGAITEIRGARQLNNVPSTSGMLAVSSAYVGAGDW